MECRTNSGPEREPATGRAAQLREEVDFWAGMLEAAGDSAPAESIERMTFALRLAEFRLRALREAACGPADAGGTVLPFTRNGG